MKPEDGTLSVLPLSGTQHQLRFGDYVAVVAGVGASLRVLRHRGRDLVVPFDADEVRPAYRGALLAPWPNRVVDGRYGFGGVEYELPLNEPDRRHALHGLVAWNAFDVVEWTTDELTLRTTVEPQTGYPWRVAIETTFRLGPDGLRQSVRATNESSAPAPFGVASHPYLVAGPGTVEDWTLQLGAGRVLLVTDDRLIPERLVSVGSDALRFDFRTPRAIAGRQLDHAFTDLARDPAGVTRARLTGPAGTGVAISWDSACPWVQIHTADRPDGDRSASHRIGLVVEPMTCSPAAFNGVPGIDTGLQVLEPGATTTASWLISAITGH